MNVKNLPSTALVWQAHLDLELQAPRSQHRGVEEVAAIRDPDDEDVIERLHPVELREQLIDDVVVDHGGGGAAAASRLHDGVDFV